MLINISLCLSDIPRDKIKQAANGKKYINICVASLREISQYGETHTVYVSQTKEEREASTPTIFIGAGKEFQPKPILTAENVDAMPVANSSDDLPY
ncbi:hypothetical protein EZS27_011992 [termite gut metagenome]|uniref:Uncharacterized protein n=1 Tax=termite gut metagenome TaxID=433724 RepID=A0A5J4S235_9ZZZZ